MPEAITSVGSSAAALVEKAQRFIATLHPPQRDLTPGNEYALYPFDDARRTAFDYFAPSSQFTLGLPLRYMNPQQRLAARELLAASLSSEGAQLVEQIAALENVLEARELNNPLFVRDPLAYYVAIFGTPAATGAWSWRYQGHHVALHWTMLDNEVISATPQFLGAQPMEVLSTDWNSDMLKVGTQVLEAAEKEAWALLTLLDAKQVRHAHLGTPWDLETTNAARARSDRRPNRFEDRGITYASLTKLQQDQLRKLVQAHAAYQLEAVREARKRRIEAAGWDGVRFSFTRSDDALYYRVRGSTFLIEYLNKAFTAPELPADHQHSVWRDFDNDWGLDQLSR
jgi:hypothetical protein